MIGTCGSDLVSQPQVLTITPASGRIENRVSRGMTRALGRANFVACHEHGTVLSERFSAKFMGPPGLPVMGIAEFRESLDFEPCGCSDPWGWIAETPDPKPKPVAIPVPYTCWKCSDTYFGQHLLHVGGYAW